MLLPVQILFGLIGWTVMRRLGYFTDHVRGNKGMTLYVMRLLKRSILTLPA